MSDKKTKTNRSGHYIAIEAIKKKLLGKTLNYQDIFHLMDEIANHRMGEILTTYFVAASFKEGFSDEELYFLTKAMVETGEKIKFKGIVADKHSTGGVAGTRTTMILVPIIAAAGFKIPKLSSRAITSPAGTADCMEVLAPVTIDPKKLKKIVEEKGGCIVWNGIMGIAPADDIIIEVEEPLSFESYDKIIVSIIAKKVAISTNHLVLDIPVGGTMKIKRFEDANRVAEKFKKLCRRFDIKVEIDINHTLEPAGRGVGPVLEARDALRVLERNKDRPLKLEAKALRLAGKLLNICYKDNGKTNGEEEARTLLESGAALKKFHEIVKAQGGNPDVTSDKIETAKYKKIIPSQKTGKIVQINNYNLNSTAKILGAPQDAKAGIYLHKRYDETVEKKEDLLTLYSSSKYQLDEALSSIKYLPIFKVE